MIVNRCVKNKANHVNHGKGDFNVTYNTTPDKTKLTSTPNTTKASVESEKDGVEIWLFSTPT